MIIIGQFSVSIFSAAIDKQIIHLFIERNVERNVPLVCNVLDNK